VLWDPIGVGEVLVRRRGARERRIKAVGDGAHMESREEGLGLAYAGGVGI